MWDTGYSDWGFCGSPEFLQVIARIVHWLGNICFLPQPFQFICHPSFNSIWSAVYSTVKDPCNKFWFDSTLRFFHSEGSVFSSRHGSWLSWLRFLVLFFSISKYSCINPQVLCFYDFNPEERSSKMFSLSRLGCFTPDYKAEILLALHLCLGLP